MLDMAYYAFKHAGRLDTAEGRMMERGRKARYHQRMQDQFETLEWEPECFDIPQESIRLLDVGCGLMPYRHLLADANAGRINRYFGLDKQGFENGPYMLSDSGMAALAIRADVDEVTDDAEWRDTKATVLFFAESLHCFEDPLTVLENMVVKLQTVKDILVLDVAEESCLGMGMDYHMRAHGCFGKIDLEHIKMFAKKLDAKDVGTQSPSSQHNLYRIMLK